MKALESISPHAFPDISGYSLVEQLYLGSRTAVYRSVQTSTQRPVVIKILRQEYPSFGELVQFRNQYAITKNLPIPGIVQPLSLEPLGSGYALVMADEGEIALGKYVQQQRLTVTEILGIALQLADTLHELAQHRVVHKDIKPANILIHPDSKQVRLIDFSIASLLPKETQEIQSPNILEGTLAYLAPEQTGRMNRGIDYRTDFYALGVTLYELLTGQLPFTSSEALALMHCHIAKVPLPADRVNSDVPEQVAAIVAKLMAKNAEDRYQSALGLKHDLEQCLTQWKESGAIEPFELGARDLSDRFLIPEKLYGRETEVQTLLQAFDRVADGASELMLVAGFSGIGKTAVVNEVHKPITRRQGYFIKGKFDQFNRNIPLLAFVQALRDLMGQLLAESDVQLDQWQAKILAALGDNGQVLIDVIPELEQIIGKQSIAPELSGSAAQHRFNLLFQKFIEVFTTAEHPLVLFLDDLQWADSASLQLVKLLMNDNGYLLVLGAYRDNEVSPLHPFILTIAELRKLGTIVNTITLGALTSSDTNDLIADTLNCSTQLAKPLAELVDRKTQGNPFFTTQFLKALHGDGQITFDSNLRYWECDIAQVNALAITDDVVEFMTVQLQKLPDDTQQVLKLAACVGNQFDLATLAIVSEQSPTAVATALWKALQEGLVVPTSQVYKFFQDGEESSSGDINTAYRFLHDRIQQAAYHLIPESQKQQTHLKIGRLLLHSPSDTDYLFEMLNHFNTSIDLIINPQERQSIAQLNLLGCQQAKASMAYGTAIQYANIALSLLPNEAWQVDHAATLALHEAAAEAAYLNTEFGKAETIIQTVLQHSKNTVSCVKSHKLLIQIYISQDQQLKAVETGLEVIANLGVPLVIDWQENLPQLPDDLSRTVSMTQPEYLAALQILITITPPTHRVKPELFPAVVLTMVHLCDREGYSELAAYVYGVYGLILCAIIGDLETAHRSGQLSLALLEQYPANEWRAKVTMLFATFVCACKDSGQTTLPLLTRGVESALAVGDIEYASYCIKAYFTHLFLLGQPLESVEAARQNYLPILLQLKQEHCIEFSKIWLRATDELTGGNPSDQSLEADIQNHLESTNNQQALYSFYVAKLISCYIFSDYSQALDHASRAAEREEAAFGILVSTAHTFYHALTLLALMPSGQATSVQTVDLEKVIANQQKLQHLADHAPSNYQHKSALVSAEIARVQGHKSDAIDLYDRSIAEAKEYGYRQEESIANELAAKFYLDWGKAKIAQDYLMNAYYGYAHWGATAKVQDLERRYPQLLTPILQQQLALSSTETVSSLGHLTTIHASGKPSATSSSTSISDTLDLATLLKASQTLSGEIELDKLLASLLHTVLENAGADKGILLMPHDDQWFVEAIATIDQPTVIQSIALFASLEIPHGLIHTVKRSRQPIVIVDAMTHATLGTDAYVVQQKPKSLLCTPILHQSKLVAILYLENQVTVGAFTRDRVELLNLLCAQAAISLENARLYQQAQTYAQQLEQSQLQTVQSEKMASLGNLVAGVAHEINNPIGFLNGSIKNAKEYSKDLLEHLKLYQQHYPSPIPSIQDHAEDIDLEYLSEDFPKLLNSMNGATDRIKGISTSLRTFSRADTEHTVTANLHDGIDSTILILKYRLKANEKRPAIEVVQNYSDVPVIDCFPGQLNQVFMNILANAIDVFDERAQKTQSFKEIEANPQQITITTAIIKHQVEIRIADNGKGMPEEVKQKIFNHLFTTKGVGKGTGLGLAIARQIVEEKHHGSLEVQSELGQGTEFCIRLPICGEVP